MLSQCGLLSMICLCAAMMVGCGESQPRPHPSITFPTASLVTANEAKAELQRLIAIRGYFIFLDDDGRDEGMDSAVRLFFMPEGKVLWEQETYAGPLEYEGTYAIDSQGNLTLTFPSRPGQLPTFFFGRDQRSPFIAPKIINGSYDTANLNWPFRPVSDADQDKAYHLMGTKP